MIENNLNGWRAVGALGRLAGWKSNYPLATKTKHVRT
jgi:hypothetical protein